MTEHLLKQINDYAAHDAAAFIPACEQRYQEQVNNVAAAIARGSREKPIVLINGPSSSGKTTTTDRLFRALAGHGIQAETISMDDYYRSNGSYEVPLDEENGVPDLESPDCMDLPLLGRDLKLLVAGEEIHVPRFDFASRTCIPQTRALRLDPDEVVLIEGIHAFNPLIMGDLASKAVGVYLSVDSAVIPDDGPRLEPYMLRFLRRAQRDSLFRGTVVEDTLRQWNSVRRGERLYIDPYRGQGSLTVDTFLPYELCILMNALDERLGRNREALEQAGLAPLAALRGKVAPIDYAPYIPENSVLHEFIG